MIDQAEIEEHKRQLILKPLKSAEELRDWMYLFLGIYFPMGVVHPDSTHSPTEAMFRIYQLMENGGSENCPQVAMLSSRDSYKTLSAAAIEVLCMVHFRIKVAHAAAISSQSEKAVEYVNSFFRKIRPYLEYHGWKKTSDSKTKIEWLTDLNEVVYLRVIVLTLRGANSEHVPMLFIDEVDVVMDPRAFQEAKMIPSMYGKYYPMTVYLSTRKFAGGLMEKTLKNVKDAGGEILRWNIIDITARITREEAQVHLPKVTRYISRDLPMRNIGPKDWEALKDEEKDKYERFEAYAGIALHQMLPVMKNYLVDRNQDDVKYLYKPLSTVRNNFKALPPEMAEAQLLCNKPSSSGLVYPRFDPIENVLSIEDALERLLGEKQRVSTFEMLRQHLINLGVTFIGGTDWGFTDYTSLVVFALMPSGQIWLVDSFLQDKLEEEDIIKYMKELQEKWGIERWWCEQAYPARLVTLRKNGMKCPEFTKVVADGISAVQSKIVDSTNVRRFYVLDTPENKFIINAFGEYKWSIDGKGDIIEGKPYHDKEGISDAMDSIRYPFQNTFSKAGKIIYSIPNSADKPKTKEKTVKEIVEDQNKAMMYGKIKELAPNADMEKDKGKPVKKRVMWM
jgi:hypothetical protein